MRERKQLEIIELEIIELLKESRLSSIIKDLGIKNGGQMKIEYSEELNEYLLEGEKLCYHLALYDDGLVYASTKAIGSRIDTYLADDIRELQFVWKDSLAYEEEEEERKFFANESE